MKLHKFVLAGAVTLLGGSTIVNAATTQGRVLCDSDQNGMLSVSDTPLEGVLVAATNTSGTYSNAAYTAADGSFSLPLDLPGYYVAFVDCATAPASSTPIYPPSGVWVFSLIPSQDVVTADFLLASPACGNTTPTNLFWLSGRGTLRNGKGRSDHSFSGSLQPDCQPAFGPGGTWTDVAHNLKLGFKGGVTQTVRADLTIDGASYLEFQGTGTLKGFAGNKANYPNVYFFAYIMDRTYVNHPDLYYLRVYSGAGETLMLVSADPAHPWNVAPVPISTGDLRVLPGTCEYPPR